MKAVSQKVIGLGLPRTGTTSISKALEILGYSGSHFCILQSKQMNYLAPSSKKAFVVDNSYYKNYRKLFEENRGRPDPKYVLTTRKKEDWLVSIGKFNREEWLQSNGRFDIVDLPDIAEYETEVQDFFRQRNGELLRLNLFEEKNPWQTFCNFLSEPVPKAAFPHERPILGTKNPQ